MIFESLTYWVGGNFVLRIQAGILSNSEDAISLGKRMAKLSFDEERIVILDNAGNECEEAYVENVAFYLIKPSSMSKSSLTDDDLELRELTISEIAKHPGIDTAVVNQLTYSEAEKIVITIPGVGTEATA